jgi:hypothetical protein
VKRQTLNELFEVERRFALAAMLAADRTKRIDDDNSRLGALGFADNTLQHFAKILFHDLGAQIDEVDGRSCQVGIEEAELSLISQDLERWLAEHGEIQSGSLDARIREHYLVR